MSSYQTNQVDPGDSATDLTSPIHDQADEHAHASGAASHPAAAALIPAAGINDEHMDDGNGNGIFPGQTADEQNLEVDVCRITCLIFSDVLNMHTRSSRYIRRTTSRATQRLVVTRSSALSL
jgi:hypothetical protein